MNGSEIVRERSLEELIAEIHDLPAEEKARLVAKILGAQPGVSVIFGNGGNQVSQAELVVQINNADKDIVEVITSAIARRIEKPLG